MGTKESAVSLHVFHQIHFILHSFAIFCGIYIHLLRMLTYYKINAYCTLYIVAKLTTPQHYTYQKRGELFPYIFMYHHMDIMCELRDTDRNVTYISYANFILQDHLHFKKIDDVSNELHVYETDTNQIFSSAES
jgi:hypothetical protein